jgi:hypothetical protein
MIFFIDIKETNCTGEDDKNSRYKETGELIISKTKTVHHRQNSIN